MVLGWKRIWILMTLPAMLVLGVVAGIAIDRQFLTAYSAPEGIPPGAEDEFRLMAEAWNIIDTVYVDREALEPPGRTYGALSGMVAGLDDFGHSRFLDPEMVEAQKLLTEGAFEGIGAYVEMRDGMVVIVAPIDGSPAQEAGLMPGDVIVEVDGESVVGMALDEVVNGILGPAGSDVTLTIVDPATGATREVTITRDSVRIHDVTWARLPDSDLALVRISRFSNGVTDDLKAALGEMREDGIEGIVLDLRRNPGGLLSEAIGVASEFIGEGNVLLERDSEGSTTPVAIRPGGSALDMPLVVLVDQGSASASEIVAGAVQDAERATVVGETTFGTGTVLQEYRLSDGSALLLAVKEWLTPEERVIWRVGLEPDEVVALPPGARPALPDALRELSLDDEALGDDDQLLRAIEILELR